MMQSESEQRPHKLSYNVSVKGDQADKVVAELESKLQAAGAQSWWPSVRVLSLLCSVSTPL